jgi:hypothetical protein
MPEYGLTINYARKIDCPDSGDMAHETVPSPTLGYSDLSEFLDRMAALVRGGDFDGAARVGRAAHVNLAVDTSELVFGNVLAAGSESTVYASTYNGAESVVKVVTIRNPHDLQRYRKELAILSRLKDSSIVQLLSARALPPRYSMVLPRYHASLEVRSRAEANRASMNRNCSQPDLLPLIGLSYPWPW